MRLLANFVLAVDHPDEIELTEILGQALGNADFDVLNEVDTASAVAAIAEDIDANQRAQFQRTAFLAFRGVEGNVLGAASLVPGPAPRLRIRFVDPDIRSVMLPGEAMVEALMLHPWIKSVTLLIRERASGRSVLGGEYNGVFGGYINYITSVARRGRLFLALFVAGLAAEGALTAFAQGNNAWVGFGERLGAPFVTTGLVGLAELYMSWQERRRRPPVT